MGSPVLVDTNLLIDFLAGVPQAQKELARYDDRAISVVSRIELLVGVDGQQQVRARDFLDRFHQVDLRAEIAEEAIRVRRNTRLKLPDAILLATAHVEKRVLLTRNSKDFTAGRYVLLPYAL